MAASLGSSGNPPPLPTTHAPKALKSATSDRAVLDSQSVLLIVGNIDITSSMSLLQPFLFIEAYEMGPFSLAVLLSVSSIAKF
jgi:hypothetical protein